MSGFLKRFVMSMVASKLQRRAGHSPAASGLLNELNYRMHRGHHPGHGHGHQPYGHQPYGYGHQPYGHPGHGHPGYHGHYKHGGGYHGHYRYHGHYKKRRFW